MGTQGQVILLKQGFIGRNIKETVQDKTAEFRANAVSVVVDGADLGLKQNGINGISFNPNDEVTPVLSPAAARVIEAVNGVFKNDFEVGRLEFIQWPFQDGEKQIICIKPTALIRDPKDVFHMPTVIGNALSPVGKKADRVEHNELVGATFEADSNLKSYVKDAEDDVHFYAGLPQPSLDKDSWGHITYPIVNNELVARASGHAAFALLFSKVDGSRPDYGTSAKGEDGRLYVSYRFLGLGNCGECAAADLTGLAITSKSNAELMRIYNETARARGGKTIDSMADLPVQILVAPEKNTPKETFAIEQPETLCGDSKCCSWTAADRAPALRR